MKKKTLFLVFIFFICSIFCYSEENNYVENLVPVEKIEIEGENGIVIIESDVSKAEVYLNGIYQGKTKLTIKKLIAGDYIIQIKKGDFVSEKYFISVEKGFSLTYRIFLNEPEKN